MSWGEIIGLALTAAFFGGAVSTILGAWIARCAGGREKQSRQIKEAYARWLAARLTYSRASASFVAVFRALAVERRDSPHFPLQMEEAQRSRMMWCEAARELDAAEAVLVISVHDPAIDQQLTAMGRVTLEDLRAAVHADSDKAERVLQELRDGAQRAIGVARGASANTRGNPSRWYKPLTTLTLPIRRIVDQWSRGN